MFKGRNVVILCVCALALGFAAACNFYETDKANKLVDAANTSIKDANDKAEKGINKLDELDTAVKQIEDEATLEKARATAKSIIADLEKAKDGFTDAGNKFEEASKLKLQDKFKEYLETKGKEMKKRGELAAALLSKPQALIDSTNQEDYQKKLEPVGAKVQSLQKEADDLAAKADKIYEENKAMFKQS